MTDRKEEQAALYALHMLDPHERRILGAELRADAGLRALVEEFEDVAGRLAHLLTPESPPPASRESVLDAVREQRRSTPGILLVLPRLIRRPAFAWLAAGIFAALAVAEIVRCRRISGRESAMVEAVAAARAQATQASQAGADFRRQIDAAKAQIAELADELSHHQRSRPVERMEVVPLRAVIRRYEDAVGIVLWDGERNEGRLRLEKMPAPPLGRDYQLWVVDRKSQAFLSAGVVNPDGRGTTALTFRLATSPAGIAKFAITIEAKGGATARTADGTLILSGP